MSARDAVVLLNREHIMRKTTAMLVAATVLATIVTTPAAALTVQDKVQLQSAMAAHIERNMVDGVIPHVLLKDGVVVDLVPTKAHPMILSFGERYVLCTDFRDPEGRFVNVDFYVAKGSEGYVIFQTEIDNRASLEALMKAGKVAMVE